VAPPSGSADVATPGCPGAVGGTGSGGASLPAAAGEDVPDGGWVDELAGPRGAAGRDEVPAALATAPALEAMEGRWGAERGGR